MIDAVAVQLSAENVFYGQLAHHLWHELGYLVHLGERHVEHASDVLYRGFCRHGAERTYLRNVVVAVLAAHVIDDLTAAFHAEVYIEIGVGNALGVKEALEEEVEAQRLDLGYAYGVSDYAARAASAPGTYGYAHALGVVYKVPDHEEVIDEAHLADYPELVVRALAHRFGDGAVLLFQPLFHERMQILAAGHTARRIVYGIQHLAFEVRRAVLALVHDLQRVVQRLGKIGKDCLHLLAGFEVEFFRGEIAVVVHALGTLGDLRFFVLVGRQVVAESDALQHLLRAGILLAQVMHVVGRDEFYVVGARHGYEVRQHGLLRTQVVVLYLHVIIVAEQRLEALDHPVRLFEVAREYRLRQLARHAG